MKFPRKFVEGKSSSGLVDVYGWICGLGIGLSDGNTPRLELHKFSSGKRITLYAQSIEKQASLFLWLEPGGTGKSELLGDLGKCLIEECSEKKMQKNLFPLFSRLCFNALFGIIHKDNVDSKIRGTKKKISEKDIEKLSQIDLATIGTPVFKRAFNILVFAACSSHLIHREGKSEELAAKLNEVAAEALEMIGPSPTERVIKSLASRYTQIFFEYKGRSVGELKFSYCSSLARSWTIHCYCSRLAMQRNIHYKEMEKDLEYALSHQLLQCMLHLRHDVSFQEDCLEVEIKIDNLQCKSLQLDSYEKIDGKLKNEWYFPAKIMITIGPEQEDKVQGAFPGMSSRNPSVSVSKAKTSEMGLQLEQSVKIALQPELESKFGLGFNDSRTTTRNSTFQNWLFEESVRDVIRGKLDWTLCDNYNGKPVFNYQPNNKDQYYRACRDLARGVGSVRPFTQDGGIVFANDPSRKPIRWMLNRHLEGQTLVWFVECEIWLAYYPNKYSTECMEIRYQKFRQPVKLPLVCAPV